MDWLCVAFTNQNFASNSLLSITDYVDFPLWCIIQQHLKPHLNPLNGPSSRCVPFTAPPILRNYYTLLPLSSCYLTFYPSSFLCSLLLPCSYSLPPGCLLAAHEGWQMRGGEKQERQTSGRERIGCVVASQTSYSKLWRFYSAHIQSKQHSEIALCAILNISHIFSSFRKQYITENVPVTLWKRERERER